MPVPIPTYDTSDGNCTSTAPVTTSDPNEPECGSTFTVDLNNYIKDAGDEADVIVGIMSSSLDSIIQNKADTALQITYASTTFTTFQASVVTINNDALVSLNLILSDETTASADTVSAATSIKNILNGITIEDTTPAELTLLIEDAQALLPAAESHLASTLSYKNDLYAEVTSIEAAVDAAAVSAKVAVDGWAAQAEALKTAAEATKLNMDDRFEEIEILYGHAHDNTYYTADEGSPDYCWIISSAVLQDLDSQWNGGHDYLVDANNLID
jgi:hypothetical protein